MLLRLIVFALLLFAPLQERARAQEPEEVRRDLVHSVLPLFAHGSDQYWPRSFRDETSFGCTSRVKFGRWILREAGPDPQASRWYGIHNYGVFHCAAMVAQASRSDDLDGSDAKPSYFVLLETVQTAGASLELWTLQIGARPGSEYLLLSRTPGEEAILTFNVLQTRCPGKNQIRASYSLDIFRMDYCAIDDRKSFLRFARQMARLPVLGTLSLARDNVEDED